ncbi:hypothetical protein [Aeromicrobium sp. UC242_57]|uniref:hypothetical protein n=1 Tax=Aeromicrobium sp. UC242_57 TaxID=3374624 RepID=UPI0037B0C5B0
MTHALVTAASPDGPRLFAIALSSPGTTVDPDDHPWVGEGMKRAGTETLVLTDVPATPVGAPGDYIDRPGFWWGAIGIAVAWFGARTRRGRTAGVRRGASRSARV